LLTLLTALTPLTGTPLVAGDGIADRGGIVARIAYKPAVLIAAPNTQQAKVLQDPASGRSFRYHLDVLMDRQGICEKRLSVHAPSVDQMSLAVAVAKAMGLLWAMAENRMGRLNSRLRSGSMDVWLCVDRGPGSAEQVRRSLYIYEAMADRSGLEWIRTLAHELGHFVLPGPVGYQDPESWSTGVLGERLFLSWLRDEVANGTVLKDDLPFVSATELDDYCAKQPDALVDRILTRGVSAEALDGKDRAAMDEATALLLYVSHVHSPVVLQELLMYLPPRSLKAPNGRDFLQAYERWASAATNVRYNLPAGRCEARVFVPEGHWRIRQETGSGSETVFEGLDTMDSDRSSGEIRLKRGRWLIVRYRPGTSSASDWYPAFTLVR